MYIDTKKIKEGVILIDGNLVQTGMAISELEKIFSKKIDDRSEHVGYHQPPAIEDGKSVSLVTRYKGDKVRSLEVSIGGFPDDDMAYEYLEYWLEERGIEWVGGSHYRTEFGSLVPRLVNNIYGGDYEISISLEYNDIPNRIFSPIKENANNSINVALDGKGYKFQRIPQSEAELLPIDNFFGVEPMSIDEEREGYGKNDRLEVIYYNISTIEGGIETVIGVAEFTYFVLLDIYKSGGLFETLDGLTAEWGLIGFALERHGCGLTSENTITPYLLVFEGIHDEIPHNEELKNFQDDKKKVKALLAAAAELTSKYVKTPIEDLTTMEVTKEKNSIFLFHKKIEDVYINYQRRMS